MLAESACDRTPCDQCFPEISPEDAEAVMIFQVCASQVITGPGGAIDVNLLAVKMAMDLYGVADQPACMDKVRIMFSEYMAAAREKTDE